MENQIMCEMKFICKNCKHSQDEHTEIGNCRGYDGDEVCYCVSFEPDI